MAHLLSRHAGELEPGGHYLASENDRPMLKNVAFWAATASAEPRGVI